MSLGKMTHNQIHALVEKLSAKGVTDEQVLEVLRNDVLADKVARTFDATKHAFIGFDVARGILKDDFLSPEEIAGIYGTAYSDSELKNFDRTLPSIKLLAWLSLNGYMLVAGPPTNLNLLQVMDFNRGLFQVKGCGWSRDDVQIFSRNDLVLGLDWVAVRKKSVPGSFNQTWEAQKKLIVPCTYVPNITQVSYASTAYCRLRSPYLFQDNYVRTSSVSAAGAHVIIGNPGAEGFVITTCWGDDAGDSNVGISSARSFIA